MSAAESAAFTAASKAEVELAQARQDLSDQLTNAQESASKEVESLREKLSEAIDARSAENVAAAAVASTTVAEVEHLRKQVGALKTEGEEEKGAHGEELRASNEKLTEVYSQVVQISVLHLRSICCNLLPLHPSMMLILCFYFSSGNWLYGSNSLVVTAIFFFKLYRELDMDLRSGVVFHEL